MRVALLVLGALLVPAGGGALQEVPAAAVEQGSWHRGVSPRPLGLEEAVRTALYASPLLEAAETDVDVAYSRRREAYGGFLPELDVGYAYANSSTGRLDPTGQDITNTSWSTELMARYEIFSGFSRITGTRAARRRTEAAEARYDEVRHRVELDVKTAWYGAVAAGERVRVETRRVARQQSQLDSVEVQLARGRVARPELLRARVALNDARMALIRARSTARAADFALARTVGLDEPVTPSGEQVLDPAPLPVGPTDLWEVARERGPLARGARADAEAARSEARRSRSRYLPTLTLQGGWSWRNVEFPPQEGSWRVVVAGSLPLFDGFSREARVDEAQAASRAATADQRLAELQLREDVAAAYDLVEAALEAVRLASESVELAREELAMQRERFRLGRGSVLQVQEAEAGLAQAEADQVDARFDVHRGRAQLEYLIGTDLEGLQAEGAAP